MQRNFEDLLQMKCTGTPTMQYITRRRSKKKAVRSLASTVVKLTTRKKTAESKMQCYKCRKKGHIAAVCRADGRTNWMREAGNNAGEEYGDLF